METTSSKIISFSKQTIIDQTNDDWTKTWSDLAEFQGKIKHELHDLGIERFMFFYWFYVRDNFHGKVSEIDSDGESLNFFCEEKYLEYDNYELRAFLNKSHIFTIVVKQRVRTMNFFIEEPLEYYGGEWERQLKTLLKKFDIENSSQCYGWSKIKKEELIRKFMD